MFDELSRRLKELEGGVAIPVTVKLDDNGYLDRCCSSDECGTHFKIMFEDWRNIVRDEAAYCPLCRREAKSTEWNTQEQFQYLKDVAFSYAHEEVGRDLQNDAREFNSRQNRNSFIQMQMSYRPGHISVPVPAEATDIMTQEFRCPECSCRYSLIGAAFFCPSCGSNSILDTFANSLETVRKTIAAVPRIRQALSESENQNVAEDSIRHICENGLIKIISCFQRYSEACFHLLSNSRQFTVRQNLFQSLTDSDTFWRNATSTGYTDIVNKAEYQELTVYFQQRHLVAHQDGIVDQQYINRASDYRYNVGQRLIVSESSVIDLATIVEKLANGIAALI